MDAELLAKESEFLSRHEVLNYILDEMRAEAIEQLLSTDNNDAAEIAANQANARAVDHIRGLFRFHMNNTAKKQPNPVV